MFCLWVVRGRFDAIQICNAIQAMSFIVSTEKIFIYILVIIEKALTTNSRKSSFGLPVGNHYWRHYCVTKSRYVFTLDNHVSGSCLNNVV